MICAPQHRDADLFFITGADALGQILTWRDAEELFSLAHFIGVTRPGHVLADPGLPDGGGVADRGARAGHLLHRLPRAGGTGRPGLVPGAGRRGALHRQASSCTGSEPLTAAEEWGTGERPVHDPYSAAAGRPYGQDDGRPATPRSRHRRSAGATSRRLRGATPRGPVRAPAPYEQPSYDRRRTAVRRPGRSPGRTTATTPTRSRRQRLRPVRQAGSSTTTPYGRRSSRSTAQQALRPRSTAPTRSRTRSSSARQAYGQQRHGGSRTGSRRWSHRTAPPPHARAAACRSRPAEPRPGAQQRPQSPAETAARPPSGPASGAPGARPGGQDAEYRTEQFSFIEEPDEDSEDVIDWLKFTESRTERREEAKRRGRNRVVALVVVLVLAVAGGVGYLW